MAFKSFPDSVIIVVQNFTTPRVLTEREKESRL